MAANEAAKPRTEPWPPDARLAPPGYSSPNPLVQHSRPQVPYPTPRIIVFTPPCSPCMAIPCAPLWFLDVPPSISIEMAPLILPIFQCWVMPGVISWSLDALFAVELQKKFCFDAVLYMCRFCLRTLHQQATSGSAKCRAPTSPSTATDPPTQQVRLHQTIVPKPTTFLVHCHFLCGGPGTYK